MDNAYTFIVRSPESWQIVLQIVYNWNEPIIYAHTSINCPYNRNLEYLFLQFHCVQNVDLQIINPFVVQSGRMKSYFISLFVMSDVKEVPIKSLF